MELSEIIKDALVYPLNNVKSLILFVIIGIITGILGGASLIAMASQVSGNHYVAAGGFGFIGILVMIIGTLLISGYGLDIVKYGIERREDGDYLSDLVLDFGWFDVGCDYYNYCIDCEEA